VTKVRLQRPGRGPARPPAASPRRSAWPGGRRDGVFEADTLTGLPRKSGRPSRPVGPGL